MDLKASSSESDLPNLGTTDRTCYCNSLFTPPTRTRQNCLVSSCPCQRCEHNCRQNKTVLSCLGPVSNLQLFSLKHIIEDYWKLGLTPVGTFQQTAKLGGNIIPAVIRVCSREIGKGKTHNFDQLSSFSFRSELQQRLNAICTPHNYYMQLQLLSALHRFWSDASERMRICTFRWQKQGDVVALLVGHRLVICRSG